jgi:hypothetical protein
MAEEKENKVEETKVEEPKVETPKKPDTVKVNLAEKAKQLKETIVKVDMSKTPTQDSVVEEKPVEEEVVVVNPDIKEEVKEEVKEETPIIQEVTDEAPKIKIPQVPTDNDESPYKLSEKLQKVAEFMNETGGDLNDYVNLNRDISKLDDSEVLDEYYRSTKSHLSPEERSFLLEDSFGVDEDVDDEKTIRKKKIALKEQVAEARAHLDRQKSKYYEEIKAGGKLTEDQQKAIEFFNRYNKESVAQKQQTEESKSAFLKQTDNVFNEDFKGFDYQVGDKKFRFNVRDIDKVKTTQSDINNFVNKFVSEDNKNITDAEGYHKSLFTAMNADAIAKHFYEQGQADAIKETVANDKNINLDPRQTHGEVNVGGVKVRALGDSARDFKFKIKKKK